MLRPWDGMSIQYELRDARLVAILTGGGAVVEDGLHLSITEGRHESLEHQGEDEPYLATLTYHMAFELAGHSAPLAGQSVRAQIVIEGTHTNGRRLEIRGEGWLGYDERGHIEGTFPEAPDMFIDEVEDEEADIEAAKSAMPKKEWEALIREAQPRSSPQFLRAMIGRSSEDDFGI